MKNSRERSERAITSNCVRFNDMRGFTCRLNKTKLRSPVKKQLFSYFVKCYEKVCRRECWRAVLKKFEMFQSVYERFPPLTPFPVGFELLEPLEKKSTLMQLVSEQLDDAERVYLEFQDGDTQADYPDDMGEGSGPDPAPEGVANTLRPPDDSSMQSVPLGLGVPPGFTPGSGSCAMNQLDNPEGRPPPSSRQCPHVSNQSMSNLEYRASKFPDMLQDLKQWSVLFEDELKDREMNERLSLESRSFLRRGSLEEIPSQLPEGILIEYPQYQLSKASIEDARFQGNYYPASDFGVKNIESTMPYGEEDGFCWNQFISEASEAESSKTGRYRKNEGDFLPEVYGGSADGDLPSKQIMHVSVEGFSPQASDFQVNGLCSGGENFVNMPTPGGNNTLQIVGINRFVSAEPSADEPEQWEQWAERQLSQFDIPLEEDLSCIWHSPFRHVSIDTLPA